MLFVPIVDKSWGPLAKNVDWRCSSAGNSAQDVVMDLGLLGLGVSNPRGGVVGGWAQFVIRHSHIIYKY